jgi:hypothetical protein
MCVGTRTWSGSPAGACGVSEALQHLRASSAWIWAGLANSTFGSMLPCRPCPARPGRPSSPRLGQIDRPVQAQHLAVELAHLAQPQAAALGEDDARDHRHRRGFALELASTRRCRPG